MKKLTNQEYNIKKLEEAKAREKNAEHEYNMAKDELWKYEKFTNADKIYKNWLSKKDNLKKITFKNLVKEAGWIAKYYITAVAVYIDGKEKIVKYLETSLDDVPVAKMEKLLSSFNNFFMANIGIDGWDDDVLLIELVSTPEKMLELDHTIQYAKSDGWKPDEK